MAGRPLPWWNDELELRSNLEAFDVGTRLRMALTLEQVRHVAKLSELELTDPELEVMTKDLSAILAHVDQLQSLDTQGCAGDHHGPQALPLQPDEPRVGVSHEDALRQAPKPMDDGFAVPAFVED